MCRLAVAGLLLGLVPTSGCVAPVRRGNVSPYEPLAMASAAGREATIAAAQKVVGAWPSGHVEVDLQRRRVTAWTEPVAGIRDEAVIQVADDGAFAVTLQTQIVDVRGGWSSPEEVCAGYGYAREEQLAKAVLTAISNQEESPELASSP